MLRNISASITDALGFGDDKPETNIRDKRPAPVPKDALLELYATMHAERLAVPQAERDQALAWHVLIEQLPTLAAAIGSRNVSADARLRAMHRVARALAIAVADRPNAMLASRFEPTNLLHHVVAACLDSTADAATIGTGLSILANAAHFGCVDLLVGAGAPPLYARLLLSAFESINISRGADTHDTTLYDSEQTLTAKVISALCNLTAAPEGCEAFVASDRALLIARLEEMLSRLDAAPSPTSPRDLKSEEFMQMLQIRARTAMRSLRQADIALRELPGDKGDAARLAVMQKQASERRRAEELGIRERERREALSKSMARARRLVMGPSEREMALAANVVATRWRLRQEGRRQAKKEQAAVRRIQARWRRFRILRLTPAQRARADNAATRITRSWRASLWRRRLQKVEAEQRGIRRSLAMYREQHATLRDRADDEAQQRRLHGPTLLDIARQAVAAAELSRVKAEQEGAVAAVKASSADEVAKVRRDALAQLRALAAATEAKVEEMRAAADEAIAALKAAAKSEVDATKAAAESEMLAVRQAADAEVRAARVEAQVAAQTEANPRALPPAGLLAATKQAARAAGMADERKRALEEVRSARLSAEQEVRQTKSAAVKEVASAHAAAMAEVTAVRASATVELAAMESHAQAEVTAVRANIECELAGLRATAAGESAAVAETQARLEERSKALEFEAAEAQAAAAAAAAVSEAAAEATVRELRAQAVQQTEKAARAAKEAAAVQAELEMQVAALRLRLEPPDDRAAEMAAKAATSALEELAIVAPDLLGQTGGAGDVDQGKGRPFAPQLPASSSMGDVPNLKNDLRGDKSWDGADKGRVFRPRDRTDGDIQFRGWTLQSWLASLHLDKVVADALLQHVRKHCRDPRIERKFMETLGGTGTVETIYALLGDALVLEQLSAALFKGGAALSEEGHARARALAQQEEETATLKRKQEMERRAGKGGTGADVAPGGLLATLGLNAARGMRKPRRPPVSDELTVEQLHAKFQEAGAFELSFGSTPSFFAGLRGLVGLPAADLEAGMLHEHCGRADADTPMVAPNYDTATSSRVEWWFVVDPSDARLAELKQIEWPDDAAAVHKRTARSPREYRQVWAIFDGQLQEMGELPLSLSEFHAARLYTGPLFIKYNAVLRGQQSDARRTVPVLKDAFERLCQGNTYTTTLHVINVAICKLSKITKISRVYRAPGGLLPEAFSSEDKFGVCGGVEFAFMSATLNRDVALQYASRSRAGILFELKPGLADRGADLAWLSQYPEEKEICFPAFCGLFVDNKRVEGSVLIVELTVSSHYSDGAINRELADREEERRADLEALEAARDQARGGVSAERKLAEAAAAACKVEREGVIKQAVDVLRRATRSSVAHGIRAIVEAVQAAKPFCSEGRVELVRSELELALTWAEYVQAEAAAAEMRAAARADARAQQEAEAEAAAKEASRGVADATEEGGKGEGGMNLIAAEARLSPLEQIAVAHGMQREAVLAQRAQEMLSARQEEVRRAAAAAEVAAAASVVAAQMVAAEHERELNEIRGLAATAGVRHQQVMELATVPPRLTLETPSASSVRRERVKSPQRGLRSSHSALGLASSPIRRLGAPSSCPPSSPSLPSHPDEVVQTAGAAVVEENRSPLAVPAGAGSPAKGAVASTKGAVAKGAVTSFTCGGAGATKRGGATATARLPPLATTGRQAR